MQACRYVVLHLQCCFPIPPPPNVKEIKHLKKPWTTKTQSNCVQPNNIITGIMCQHRSLQYTVYVHMCLSFHTGSTKCWSKISWTRDLKKNKPSPLIEFKCVIMNYWIKMCWKCKLKSFWHVSPYTLVSIWKPYRLCSTEFSDSALSNEAIRRWKEFCENMPLSTQQAYLIKAQLSSEVHILKSSLNSVSLNYFEIYQIRFLNGWQRTK